MITERITVPQSLGTANKEVSLPLSNIWSHFVFGKTNYRSENYPRVMDTDSIHAALIRTADSCGDDTTVRIKPRH